MKISSAAAGLSIIMLAAAHVTVLFVAIGLELNIKQSRTCVLKDDLPTYCMQNHVANDTLHREEVIIVVGWPH